MWETLGFWGLIGLLFGGFLGNIIIGWIFYRLSKTTSAEPVLSSGTIATFSDAFLIISAVIFAEIGIGTLIADRIHYSGWGMELVPMSGVVLILISLVTFQTVFFLRSILYRIDKKTLMLSLLIAAFWLFGVGISYLLLFMVGMRITVTF